ncbi:Ran-GTPase activating protein 1, C-terminal,Leucine-rich repeat,Leucine-rich repeat domain, L [Cinara cedri]|uniref:Ran-GTPase activating protein 1, C-terminal,Leucine-rich repeat,Leucine-rich repeat domain, L n=1 Tax=Cinara cedri TaxID=506608 RepID=A0A5E4MHZ2_9HEMI|nr:Ran-GTPase activating protein 1, C-terminal,Leucine-rich repeat,Leucine-rich repeat domain, L [Cinara cedri]
MEDNGLSFADQSLSLNSVEDAKSIVSAIEKCPCLIYFNLQGNTLGIEAAKEIGNALAKHGSLLKRALWQDMFTGRLKSEIPIVLEHLSAGLLTANVRLSELDLSNNAFGPIGMEGLVKLLNSPVCYELQTLRLMNNGLGIGGAKMLAKALIDNYNASLKAGTPFKLKVLVAGRNRLENEGIIALSQFFSLVKSMEEITIPQNGIYCKGILALTSSLLENPNLKVLDVQDNLLTPLGAEALAKVLPKLKNLKRLNIADCLIKSKGALAIAEALNIHRSLEILDASYNEINSESGLKLTESICNKINLKEYNINGNRFGEETIEVISNVLKGSNKDKTLGSFSGDEGECSSDEDDNEEAAESSTDEENDNSTFNTDNSADLLKNMVIGEVKPTKETVENINCEVLVDQLMDIAVHYHNSDDNVTLDKCLEFYKTAYSNATKTLKFIELTNVLLVKHGLIKSEDKGFKLRKDVDRCLEVLKKVVQNKNVIPESSRCVLNFMLNKV